MKIKEEPSGLVIYLDPGEAKELCKIGMGADTCIWCMFGQAFECRYFSRPTALNRRWSDGLTVAKRDGCGVIEALPYEIKYVEAATFADMLEKGGEFDRESPDIEGAG